MERRIALIAVVLGCLLLAPNLLALPITVGTFNIAGTVTATVNNITWTSNQSPFPADTAAIGPSPTGIYSALGGTTATIDDLTRSTEPVTSSTFTAEPFLNFNANPSLSALDVNLIYAGQYSAAGCAASPADVGQTCTPSVPGANSPFSFTNTPPTIRRRAILAGAVDRLGCFGRWPVYLDGHLYLAVLRVLPAGVVGVCSRRLGLGKQHVFSDGHCDGKFSFRTGAWHCDSLGLRAGCHVRLPAAEVQQAVKRPIRFT